jgi:hypothetical protein
MDAIAPGGAVLARLRLAGAGMTPHCPTCNEPMKEHGRLFLCEPCRQIIIFLVVSETSPYIASRGVAVASNERRSSEAAGVCTENLIRVADVMESPKLAE